MQVYSLCVFGTNLIESLKVPPYAYGNEGKRKHCMLRCGNGFSWLPSRDLSMQKYLRHMSVSCAIRWAGRRGSVLPSQAKTRSQILLRCDQLTAKACRTKILSIVGKGMGLSKGQDAMGYAKNGCKFALAPSDERMGFPGPKALGRNPLVTLLFALTKIPGPTNPPDLPPVPLPRPEVR
eukprot:scaffold29445_cov16-Tisochrysis_lutea.AAC.1